MKAHHSPQQTRFPCVGNGMSDRIAAYVGFYYFGTI